MHLHHTESPHHSPPKNAVIASLMLAWCRVDHLGGPFHVAFAPGGRFLGWPV